jgi:ribonuclease BN (tRNA processing enzyme)
MRPALAIRFLGVGSAQAPELGSSACVLERNREPLLVIDCGPDNLSPFRVAYVDREPPALFLTHAHFDHIGGLETWFYRLMTGPGRGPPRVPAPPVAAHGALSLRL